MAHTDGMVDTDAEQRVASSRLARGVWFGLGWLAVALGGIGVIVPGLPTTVFMILAAACFARCSPRFEQWILDLPGIGRSVTDYRSGLGMPMRAKVLAITMLVVAVSLSAGLVLANIALRVAVVAVGLVGVVFIAAKVPTKPTPAPDTTPSEPV